MMQFTRRCERHRTAVLARLWIKMHSPPRRGEDFQSGGAVRPRGSMSDMEERLTIRISRELRQKIDQHARVSQQDPSKIVRDALEHYLKPSRSAHDAFRKAGLIGIIKAGP